VKERDPCLSAAGSFFFPGLGQVYCGRIFRGIVFLVPTLLLSILNYLPLYFVHDSGAYWLLSTVPGLLGQIVQFAVRIIATYDAYNVAKSTEVVQPGSRQWP
jgi:TM2 domain-containing membrane protein YozV